MDNEQLNRYQSSISSAEETLHQILQQNVSHEVAISSLQHELAKYTRRDHQLASENPTGKNEVEKRLKDKIKNLSEAIGKRSQVEIELRTRFRERVKLRSDRLNILRNEKVEIEIEKGKLEIQVKHLESFLSLEVQSDQIYEERAQQRLLEDMHRDEATREADLKRFYKTEEELLSLKGKDYLKESEYFNELISSGEHRLGQEEDMLQRQSDVVDMLIQDNDECKKKLKELVSLDSRFEETASKENALAAGVELQIGRIRQLKLVLEEKERAVEVAQVDVAHDAEVEQRINQQARQCDNLRKRLLEARQQIAVHRQTRSDVKVNKSDILHDLVQARETLAHERRYFEVEVRKAELDLSSTAAEVNQVSAKLHEARSVQQQTEAEYFKSADELEQMRKKDETLRQMSSRYAQCLLEQLDSDPSQ